MVENYRRVVVRKEERGIFKIITLAQVNPFATICELNLYTAQTIQ